jgi:hypothetical protein
MYWLEYQRCSSYSRSDLPCRGILSIPDLTKQESILVKVGLELLTVLAHQRPRLVSLLRPRNQTVYSDLTNTVSVDRRRFEKTYSIARKRQSTIATSSFRDLRLDNAESMLSQTARSHNSPGSQSSRYSVRELAEVPTPALSGTYHQTLQFPVPKRYNTVLESGNMQPNAEQGDVSIPRI